MLLGASSAPTSQRATPLPSPSTGRISTRAWCGSHKLSRLMLSITASADMQYADGPGYFANPKEALKAQAKRFECKSHGADCAARHFSLGSADGSAGAGQRGRFANRRERVETTTWRFDLDLMRI